MREIMGGMSMVLAIMWAVVLGYHYIPEDWWQIPAIITLAALAALFTIWVFHPRKGGEHG